MAIQCEAGHESSRDEAFLDLHVTMSTLQQGKKRKQGSAACVREHAQISSEPLDFSPEFFNLYPANPPGFPAAGAGRRRLRSGRKYATWS